MIFKRNNTTYKASILRTERGTDSGHGQDYSSKTEPAAWLVWVEDMWSPSIWYISGCGLEEAYEHATICLCQEWTTDELTPDEQARLAACEQRQLDTDAYWTLLDELAVGCTLAEDGKYYYTETLQIIQIRGPQIY